MHDSIMEKNTALEAQVKGLIDLMDKVVTESGRMALPDSNIDPVTRASFCCSSGMLMRSPFAAS